MRVLYVQYTNPGAYPPLVRGARLLRDAGATVLMLGAHVPALDALSVDASAGLDVRLLASPPAAREGWRLKANYARYAAWVARLGRAWRPDWIYASDVLSAPVALALAAMTGARIVYHEHDAPSPDHDTWTMRRFLAARRHLARQADTVVVPNADRARHLSREVGGGCEVHTVWNCPLRPVTMPLREGSLRDDHTLSVLFRGSVNAQRLPRTVIEAIAKAGAPVTLDIVGYETAGSRGYIDELLRLAKTSGVEGRVRAYGTLSESQLVHIAARADVGLALMPTESTDVNMRHMVGASNKVFEYLGQGIVPIVSDLPDWRASFVDPGYALCAVPELGASLARTFTWAADHAVELRTIAKRGFARVERDWNYETQFAPVMRRMLAADPTRSVPTPEEELCAS